LPAPRLVLSKMEEILVAPVAAPWREEVLGKINELEDLLVSNSNTKREIKSVIKDLSGLLRLIVVSERPTAQGGNDKAVQVNQDSPPGQGKGQQVVIDKDITITVVNGATLNVVHGGMAEAWKQIPVQKRNKPQHTKEDMPGQQNEAVQQNNWRTVQRKKKGWMTKQTAERNGSKVKEAPKKVAKVSVLEVSGEGKSYADMVRSLKDKFGTETETNFLAIRRNGAGNMTIHTQNPQEETFKKIKEIEGLNVQHRVKKQHLLLRDIDVTIDKEELEKTLKKVTNNGDVKITSMRMAYGDTKRATFTVEEGAGKTLLEAGRVCVGLVRCRVSQFKELPRCYRCWQRGHMMAVCKGPDRTKRCFRCGDEGHKVEECQNETKCLECNKTGHRTETCQEGKQTVNENTTG
jgi:hypothetical protein